MNNYKLLKAASILRLNQMRKEAINFGALGKQLGALGRNVGRRAQPYAQQAVSGLSTVAQKAQPYAQKAMQNPYVAKGVQFAQKNPMAAGAIGGGAAGMIGGDGIGDGITGAALGGLGGFYGPQLMRQYGPKLQQFMR